jgi:Uncharacterised protein conserved in bacteria (DUF2313)
MSSNLMQYLPRFYNGVYEMEEITKVEDYLFDNFFDVELVNLVNNQYFRTSDESTVYAYEKMLGISVNPILETLEFRRERLLNRYSMKLPYSFKFLTNRLDSIIGKGKYTADIDYAGYTLTIESSAANQAWFNEIRIMINAIKPANIVFKNIPLVSNSLSINEAIETGTYTFNYHVGTTARASLTKPIAAINDLIEVLGAEQMSIQSSLTDRLADYTAGEVENVLINDVYVITDFTKKEGIGDTIEITYTIPAASGITIVNNIKLRDAADANLTNSAVYFIVSDDVLVKHTIPIKEGV